MIATRASTVPAAPALLSAADLDRALDEQWQSAGVTPAAPAPDPEFLRRITLDLAGRIPTLDEAEAFLASPAPNKRARLVEALLASPDYAEHWGDVYLDLFVGRQFRKPGLEKKLDPRAYFVRAFRENRPFDQIAREMLTFSGEILPNGPGVFLASHLKGGGPETAAAVTARLFLGVQIQCAQCHDHPYDARYKQEDFYGLVAFFARTKDRQEKRDVVAAELAAARTMDGAAPEPPPGMSTAAATAAAGMANDAPGPRAAPVSEPGDKNEKAFFVIDKPRGNAKFKKPGAMADTVVPPRFFGRSVAPLSGEGPRDTLARAVVGSDLFAKTLVDRTWAQLFGSGVLEPWDDLGGENDPHHPALLNRLAADFRASGFDIKHLLRILVLSRAYGLTSRDGAAPPSVADAARGAAGNTPTSAAVPASLPAPVASAAADQPAAARFARASVRRMSPEQLFRSMLVATAADHMERNGVEEMDKKITRLLRECLFIFGDDEGAEINTFNGNIPQALFLWNGEIVNQGARSRPGGTLARILAESRAPSERLRRLFMAAYARPPTNEEVDRLSPTLAGHQAPALYEDLFFAMLTSSEMLTIH